MEEKERERVWEERRFDFLCVGLFFFVECITHTRRERESRQKEGHLPKSRVLALGCVPALLVCKSKNEVW
jgi:hypothetical protein